MNCRNCGAPFVAVDESGNFRCDDCHAYLPAAAIEQQTTDGVRRTGRDLEENQCPRCETPLEIGLVNGIKVALCADCHGILLPRHDFAELVLQRRARFQGAADPGPPLNIDELHRPATCPACAERMETYPYGGPGAVVIDCCQSCDLIWMDAGELNRLERAPLPRDPEALSQSDTGLA